MLKPLLQSPHSVCTQSTVEAMLLWRAQTHAGPAKLYVGNCQEACHWAGQHVATIINCANVDYPHHPWCVRQWLNLNFKGLLNGVEWNERVDAAVKLALQTLARGKSVLIHCRQGKLRSAAFSALLMALLQGINLQEALRMYQLYNERVRGPDDEKRMAGLMLKHKVAAKLAQLQAEQWCADLIRCIDEGAPPLACPREQLPRQDPVPLSSGRGRPLERSRTRSPPWLPRHRRNFGSPAKEVAARHPPSIFCITAAADMSPAAPKPAIGAPAPPQVPVAPPAAPKPAIGAPAHLRSPAMAMTVDEAPPGVARFNLWPATSPSSAAPQCAPPATSAPIVDAPAALPAAVQCPEQGVPSCEGDAGDSAAEAAQYAEAARGRGVWEAVDVQEKEAGEALRRSRSPSQEIPAEGVWSCSACQSLNSRHKLFCGREDCEARRPHLQTWHDGDWHCDMCGNHNFWFRKTCAWNHCVTNDWMCPNCGNQNFSDRKWCNRFVCRHPRPAREQ